ncbi:hypothetical protein [Streptomyces sp. B22F1]|uniref:hypothetical protein n=1 Tax=Streptomyces sp. B22F1 TaxID=3153566 RepID=UPI00325E476D
MLRDGLRKLEAEVVDREWDGRWTLLAFSVPETRRADRHALRTRLGWAGFAPLRSGLWVSPGTADGCLPALLPPEWPGVRAQEMFRTLRAELIGPSDELAAAWLATIADAGAQHPSANV